MSTGNVPARLVIAIGLCIGMLASFDTPAGAVRITEEDTNGFYGIRWGSPLAEIPELILVESSGDVQTYELRTTPLLVGQVPVDALRLVAFKGEFARAFFRYSGQETHRDMMAYLERRYGPVDRTPGSMMRGLNQQFTWRGSDTEVNLTYHSYQERGTVFIESRTLAPRFYDILPEHAF
jgi:hypothetical protein